MLGLCGRVEGRKGPAALNPQTDFLKWFDYNMEMGRRVDKACHCKDMTAYPNQPVSASCQRSTNKDMGGGVDSKLNLMQDY